MCVLALQNHSDPSPRGSAPHPAGALPQTPLGLTPQTPNRLPWPSASPSSPSLCNRELKPGALPATMPHGAITMLRLLSGIVTSTRSIGGVGSGEYYS